MKVNVYRTHYTPAFNRTGGELWDVEMVKIGEADSHQDAIERFGSAAITEPIRG